MKMYLAVEIAPPRSDISTTLVNHMENIKRHKPEITRELFDILYYEMASGKLSATEGVYIYDN